MASCFLGAAVLHHHQSAPLSLVCFAVCSFTAVVYGLSNERKHSCDCMLGGGTGLLRHGMRGELRVKVMCVCLLHCCTHVLWHGRGSNSRLSAAPKRERYGALEPIHRPITIFRPRSTGGRAVGRAWELYTAGAARARACAGRSSSLDRGSVCDGRSSKKGGPRGAQRHCQTSTA